MSQSPTITLSMIESEIGLLTLDMPNKGANVLSHTVLDELENQLDQLEQRNDLAGLIVVSGKPGMFIAGADLREFAASMDIEREQAVETCRRGQTLFGRLSKTPFVTVAAIDGVCLGGGAELAVWCDRRLLSDGARTEIGFPEVKIGLFPGWGGTARLPRMVGLSNALEMITSGESISAENAVAMGLATDVVPVEQLLPAAIDLVRQERASGEYLADRQRWSQAIEISETELGFLGATASALVRQQTKDQYPAPMAALEVMLEAAYEDVEQACRMEAESMSHLFGSPINAALINVFFLTDRVKKDLGVDDGSARPRSIASAGVIGAGIMGGGIAAANLKQNIPVVLLDASHEALQRGAAAVVEEAAYNRAIKGPDVTRAVQLGALLNLGRHEADLAECDLVIEAVIENQEVKQQLFSQIEPQLPQNAILASNTSTIPITRLAENLARPQQFCGIHFFNPVRRMKLVEVIRGAQTSDETVVSAVAYAKRLGKFPVVVNDGPGFVVNRLLLPYMNEAVELICEGAAIKDVERAARAFGMPMGPIHLYDVVGLDTAVFAGQTMQRAFPDRVVESGLLPAMVAAGRLGQKSGRGFFSYENRKRRAEPDPDFDAFLQPFLRSRSQLSLEVITSRLFLPMLLEATRVLEEDIVRDPRDVDLALIFGIGFPPFKGGLLYWADSLGAAQLVEMLKPFASLGERSRPTPLLLEMAARGSRFYD